MTYLQGKRAAIAVLIAACAVAVAGAATLSDVLSPQPVIVPEATQEEPAGFAGSSVVGPKTVGCWEVTLAQTQLDARWIDVCEAGQPAEMGPRAWHVGTLRLMAPAGALPLMAHSQTHAELSTELAQRGEGALLFLPTSAAGAGFYVAAWVAPARDADGDGDADDAGERPTAAAERGFQVGVYGAPPVSVITPGGRVYLQPDFAPGHALAGNARQELEPAAEESEVGADGPGDGRSAPLPELDAPAVGAEPPAG